MKMAFEKPYSVDQVDQGDNGCEKCKQGATWDVLDPDGIALGTSYGDVDDAKDMAEELNKAFELGMAKEKASRESSI